MWCFLFKMSAETKNILLVWVIMGIRFNSTNKCTLTAWFMWVLWINRYAWGFAGHAGRMEKPHRLVIEMALCLTNWASWTMDHWMKMNFRNALAMLRVPEQSIIYIYIYPSFSGKWRFPRSHKSLGQNSCATHHNCSELLHVLVLF